MKKIALIFLFVCFSGSIALAGFMTISAGSSSGTEEQGGPECTGTTTFIWEMNSVDVTDGGCVIAGGDSVASATGSPTFAGGAATYATSSTYHSFDASGDNLVDSDISTVFIRFKINVEADGGQLFNFYADSTNRIYGYTTSTDGFVLRHIGNSTDVQCADYAMSIATATEYIFRFRWRTGTYTPDSDMYLYNTDCELIDYQENDTPLGNFSTEFSTGDIRIGNSSGTAQSITIYYVHIYAGDWRETDPEGDCSAF